MAASTRSLQSRVISGRVQKQGSPLSRSHNDRSDTKAAEHSDASEELDSDGDIHSRIKLSPEPDDGISGKEETEWRKISRLKAQEYLTAITELSEDSLQTPTYDVLAPSEERRARYGQIIRDKWGSHWTRHLLDRNREKAPPPHKLRAPVTAIGLRPNFLPPVNLDEYERDLSLTLLKHVAILAHWMSLEVANENLSASIRLRRSNSLRPRSTRKMTAADIKVVLLEFGTEETKGKTWNELVSAALGDTSFDVSA